MKRKRFHFLNVLLITLNILADNVIYYLLINIPIGLKRVLYIKSSCNNYYYIRDYAVQIPPVGHVSASRAQIVYKLQ